MKKVIFFTIFLSISQLWAMVPQPTRIPTNVYIAQQRGATTKKLGQTIAPSYQTYITKALPKSYAPSSSYSTRAMAIAEAQRTKHYPTIQKRGYSFGTTQPPYQRSIQPKTLLAMQKITTQQPPNLAQVSIISAAKISNNIEQFMHQLVTSKKPRAVSLKDKAQQFEQLIEMLEATKFPVTTGRIFTLWGLLPGTAVIEEQSVDTATPLAAAAALRYHLFSRIITAEIKQAIAIIDIMLQQQLPTHEKEQLEQQKQKIIASENKLEQQYKQLLTQPIIPGSQKTFGDQISQMLELVHALEEHIAKTHKNERLEQLKEIALKKIGRTQDID